MSEDVEKSHLMILDKMQQFINVAAHELKASIELILGLTQILRSRIKDSQQQQQLLNIIVRNAKRLNRLSGEILDVARLESQKLELKKELLNLNDIIPHAIVDIMLGKEMSSKNIHVLYESPDILLQADKSRIAEVISSLLKEKNNRNDNKNGVIVDLKILVKA